MTLDHKNVRSNSKSYQLIVKPRHLGHPVDHRVRSKIVWWFILSFPIVVDRKRQWPKSSSYKIIRMTWLLTPPHYLKDADHCANRTFQHESVVRSNREYGVVSLVPLLIVLQAVRIVTSKDTVVCRLLGRLLMWNFRWLPPQIALLGVPAFNLNRRLSFRWKPRALFGF